MLAVYVVSLRTIDAHVGLLRAAPIALPSAYPVTLRVL